MNDIGESDELIQLMPSSETLTESSCASLSGLGRISAGSASEELGVVDPVVSENLS